MDHVDPVLPGFERLEDALELHLAILLFRPELLRNSSIWRKENYDSLLSGIWCSSRTDPGKAAQKWRCRSRGSDGSEEVTSVDRVFHGQDSGIKG